MDNDYFSTGCGDIMGETHEENCIPTHWMPEEVNKLIDTVQMDEAIYNPHHQYHFSQPYVNNFWHNLDIQLNKKPGECLSKWLYLRQKFRREYSNYMKDKIRPCWSYFERMCFLQSFLKKKVHHRRAVDPRLMGTVRPNGSYCNYLDQSRLDAQAHGAVGGHDSPNESEQSTEARQYNNVVHYSDAEYKKINETQMQDEHMEDDLENEPKDTSRDYRPDMRAHCENSEERERSDSTINNFVMDSLMSVRNVAREESRQYMERKKLAQERVEQALEAHVPIHQYTHNEPYYQQNNILKHPVYMQQRPGILGSNTQAPSRTLRDYPSHGRSSITTSNQSIHGDYPHRSVRISDNPPDILEPMTNGTCQNASPHGYLNKYMARDDDDDDEDVDDSQDDYMKTAPVPQHSMAAHCKQLSNENQCNAIVEEPDEQPTVAIHSPTCDCKTDPDAMFLMSLLPDIRKMDGRRRSKLKIEFQRLLLEYTYPE